MPETENTNLNGGAGAGTEASAPAADATQAAAPAEAAPVVTGNAAPADATQAAPAAETTQAAPAESAPVTTVTDMSQSAPVVTGDAAPAADATQSAPAEEVKEPAAEETQAEEAKEPAAEEASETTEEQAPAATATVTEEQAAPAPEQTTITTDAGAPPVQASSGIVSDIVNKVEEVGSKVIGAVESLFHHSSGSAPTDFESKIKYLLENGTVTEKEVIRVMENYISELAPGKPVDAATGVRIQYGLWKLIQNVTHNVPLDHFGGAWTLILDYFKQYATTVFSERYVYRFADAWTYPTSELRSFQAAINLIKLTANKETRALGLKQVDLEKVFSTGLLAEARQRLLTFYQNDM